MVYLTWSQNTDTWLTGMQALAKSCHAAYLGPFGPAACCVGAGRWCCQTMQSWSAAACDCAVYGLRVPHMVSNGQWNTLTCML